MEEMKEEIEKSVIRIGPKLRLVLDEQKKRIEKLTGECVKPSDFEAGEIIAKKLLGEM